MNVIELLPVVLVKTMQLNKFKKLYTFNNKQFKIIVVLKILANFVYKFAEQ